VFLHLQRFVLWTSLRASSWAILETMKRYGSGLQSCRLCWLMAWMGLHYGVFDDTCDRRVGRTRMQTLKESSHNVGCDVEKQSFS